MSPPQRSEEHGRLDFMAGTWKTTETYPAAPWMPEGGSGRGEAAIQWKLNRMVLVTDYRTEGSAGFTFEGHGLMTWDPVGNAYMGYWFDSMMPTGAGGRGQIEDGSLVILYRHRTPQGERQIRSVATKVSDDEFRMVGSSLVDGTWIEAVRIKYERVG